MTSGSAVEDATNAAPPATVTNPPETVAKQRRMPSRLDQPRRRAFELWHHITVPMTARAAAAAATFGAASHEMALAKKPAGAAAAPARHAVAAARQTVADEAAPRAPFTLAASSPRVDGVSRERPASGGRWLSEFEQAPSS